MHKLTRTRAHTCTPCWTVLFQINLSLSASVPSLIYPSVYLPLFCWIFCLLLSEIFQIKPKSTCLCRKNNKFRTKKKDHIWFWSMQHLQAGQLNFFTPTPLISCAMWLVFPKSTVASMFSRFTSCFDKLELSLLPLQIKSSNSWWGHQ